MSGLRTTADPDRTDARVTVDPSDPLSIFSEIAEVEVSADEIEEMQRQVVALASWEDLSTVQGASDEAPPFDEPNRLRWGFAAAAAVVLTAGIAVGLGSIGVGPFAGMEQRPEGKNELAEEISAEMRDLLAALPLVEDLDSSTGRLTYELDEGDIDLVMVVDERLDL